MSPRPHRSPAITRAVDARRYNRLAHGLCAADLVIPDAESEDDWHRFEAHVMRGLQPEGAIEVALAARVAGSLWRLARIPRAERDDFVVARRHAESGQLLTPDSERPARWRRTAFLPDPAHLDRLIRYEAHLSRQLYQALHELEARQARRTGDPAPLARLDINTLPETASMPPGET